MTKSTRLASFDHVTFTRARMSRFNNRSFHFPIELHKNAVFDACPTRRARLTPVPRALDTAGGLQEARTRKLDCPAFVFGVAIGRNGRGRVDRRVLHAADLVVFLSASKTCQFVGKSRRENGKRNYRMIGEEPIPLIE
jgi:hypothetical protein